MAAKKFLVLCYLFSRLVDQRKNNKNTEVAVINMYCNDLKQNGELILNILLDTILTIYDEYLFVKESKYSNIRKQYSFQYFCCSKLSSMTRCFHTTPYKLLMVSVQYYWSILI